ncbi:sigma-70 family RNA polymerase sigma factor [Lysinibacillus sp. KU-BSD001]|uniref:sigma-70 family RNA polymerase sigma factor n=1 Tax=Lysinibacillus sp. KU-BSD001 TaxID=3141328 RepID=UPI0036EE7AE9
MLSNREMNDVMDTYSGYLLQISYMYVKNWATAEDLVQESFIKYFKAANQFREEASIKTYLTRITINTCHDYLRSWKNKKQIFSRALLKRLPDQEKGIEARIIASIEQTELTKHVLRLPVMYREVILLFYYEEFTTAVMAELLGVSENTVKTRLRRARGMLKERLDDTEWEVLSHE